jgi:hypothetical protein
MRALEKGQGPTRVAACTAHCGALPQPGQQSALRPGEAVHLARSCLLAVAYCLLYIGCCALAIGYWLLSIGYCLLPIGCWLLAIGYWLLATVCCLLAVAYWLLSIAY